MTKSDFEKFPVGTVFNELATDLPERTEHPAYAGVNVSFPSRLVAMVLDPSVITTNNNLVYDAGLVGVSVDIPKVASVSPRSDGEIVVSTDTSRPSLARHAGLIMQHALRSEYGYDITVTDTHAELRHCGLGSSSAIVASVAAAINELHGKPIAPLDLVRYTAQNHGEEIDDDPGSLMPVQSTGGSAALGNFEGGIMVLAGRSTPIMRTNLPPDQKVVIGVPRDFEHPDAQTLMALEEANLQKFKHTGVHYRQLIAYRTVHEVLPGLAVGDLGPCKRLVFDYRWRYGSIRNCSFVYPPMVDIAKELEPLESDERVSLVALSSVGPGFFAVTDSPDDIAKKFDETGMEPLITDVHNQTYRPTVFIK
jgi:predicted sugar kinase